MAIGIKAGSNKELVQCGTANHVCLHKDLSVLTKDGGSVHLPTVLDVHSDSNGMGHLGVHVASPVFSVLWTVG